MSTPLAIRHLLIRLRPLNRALRLAVERQAAVAAQLDRPDLVPYCITDEQVTALLDHLDALPLPDGVGMASLTPPEQAAERQVREEALAAGVTAATGRAGRPVRADRRRNSRHCCCVPPPSWTAPTSGSSPISSTTSTAVSPASSCSPQSPPGPASAAWPTAVSLAALGGCACSGC